MMAPMRNIDMVMLQLLVHWTALPRKVGSCHWVSMMTMPTNTDAMQGWVMVLRSTARRCFFFSSGVAEAASCMK